MSLHSRITVTIMALVACLFSTAPAFAVSNILSGRFDGSEAAMEQLSDAGCKTSNPLAYLLSSFQVSKSGLYRLFNAFDAIYRQDVVAVSYRVYEGSFNPAAPSQNLRIDNTFGETDLSLSSGATYVLFVQYSCESAKNVEGIWAIALIGQGSASGSSVAAVPNFTMGTFSKSDPTMVSDIFQNGSTPYKQTGPIRVSRSGTYYFSDIFLWGFNQKGAQVTLQVYTAPVNPANPAANRVGGAAYGSPLIELQAGQNYYFVTQWIYGDKDGAFLYVLAPPAPFRINPGLAGSWHNPATPGQGFFLTVYEKLNQVFLAWFTYANGSAAVDASGQRWMTAFGSFADKSAELDVEWTSGGQFNAAEPVPTQEEGGFIQLDFTDCASGQITYGLDGDAPGAATVKGVIPIQRLANDAVALCESLYAGPGMPGPL